MKNLKIFSKITDRFKNIKLIKKAKYALLATTLVGAIFFTSCGLISIDSATENFEQNSNPINSSIKENPTLTVPPQIPKVSLDKELQKIIDTNIKISSKDSDDIKKFINNIDVEYQYSEFYNLDAALAKYASMQEFNTTSNEFIKNGKLDIQKVRERVSNNNNKFLNGYTGNKYSALTQADFEKIFAYFIETIEYTLENNIEVDITEIDYKILNLKILKTNQRGNGGVEIDDGILAINVDTVQNMQNQYKNVNFLKKVVFHETYHFIQMNSTLEKEKEGYNNNLGIAYSWSDLTVNPLYFTWFFEGTADKLTFDAYKEGINGITYLEEVKALDSIALATILSDNVDENTISRLSLQKDLNKLFEIFNCTNDKEKREVIKLMYSYDLILTNQTLTPKHFYDYYENITGTKLDYYAKQSHQYNLRASIAQTLTKKFYSNLVIKLSNKEIKLGEVFSLISLFEAEMNRITWYSTDTRLENNQEFLRNYINIQSKFFDVISKNINIDVSEIEKAYNAYNNNSISNGINVNFLNSGEINYLSAILDERVQSKKNSINEVYTSRQSR